MRVLVIGGRGLLGRAVIDQGIEAGHDIVVTGRSPRRPAGLDERVGYVPWGGTTPLPVAAVAGVDTAAAPTSQTSPPSSPIDAIINVAGATILTRWTQAAKQRLRSSRVGVNQQVAAGIEAAEHRPSVVVSASAVGFYGVSPASPCTEDAPAGDDFLARLCVDWEQALAPLPALGVRTVSMRSGVMLSAKGGALAKMLPPFRMGLGGPLGSGRQPFPWIHLDDAAAAIWHAVRTKDVQGPVNNVAPQAIDNATFTRALGRVLRRPTMFPVPGFVVRTLFGESASILTQGQSVVPQRLRATGFTWRYPDVATALEAELRA